MRQSIAPLSPFFKGRFSPRVFDDPSVSAEDVEAILEAASTAPSCFNEQPWRFVLADKEAFFALLTPGNLEWCRSLETFVLLCAAPAFERNGKPNAWARFDCGTAWGYMTYEAFERGIYLHAMAGFDARAAVERFGLQGLDPIAVIAFGKKPQPADFTPRKPLRSLLLRR